MSVLLSTVEREENLSERERERASDPNGLPSAHQAGLMSPVMVDLHGSQLWAENILCSHSENTQPVDVTSRGDLNEY